MTGMAMITEACIGTEDRAWVDVCPVQWSCGSDPVNTVVFSEVEAGSAVIERWHVANADVWSGQSAPRSEVPDGTPSSSCKSADTSMSDDHILLVQLTGDVVAGKRRWR